MGNLFSSSKHESQMAPTQANILRTLTGTCIGLMALLPWSKYVQRQLQYTCTRGTDSSAVLPYDHPQISSKCFPRSGKDTDKPVYLKDNARFIKVVTPGGFSLDCVWVEYDASQTESDKTTQKVLVHFHGNGELAWDTATDWANVFHNKIGVRACFFVEYRGYGRSTGTACFCDMQEDLPAVLSAISAAASGSLGDSNPALFVYGRSIGTVFALAFAARFPTSVAGLILESGIAKITEWVPWYACKRDLETPDEFLRSLEFSDEAMASCAANYLDVCKRLQVYTGPLLVLHTVNDKIVSAEHARTFNNFAAIASNRSINRLVLFERGGHNDIHGRNMVEYLSELQGFARDIANGNGWVECEARV